MDDAFHAACPPPLDLFMVLARTTHYMSHQSAAVPYVVSDGLLRHLEDRHSLQDATIIGTILFLVFSAVHIENRLASCLHCAIDNSVILITGGAYGEDS